MPRGRRRLDLRISHNGPRTYAAAWLHEMLLEETAVSTRNKRTHSILVAAALVGCAFSASAAETTKHACPPLTKEAREKMAVVHEQMAACLRSDKTTAECHTEMSKSHAELMRASGCPERKMHPHMGSHSNLPEPG
jgi:putative SOS response-associated peptidase YedK